MPAFLMQVLLNGILFVLPVGTRLSLSLGIDIREVSCRVKSVTRPPERREVFLKELFLAHYTGVGVSLKKELQALVNFVHTLRVTVIVSLVFDDMDSFFNDDF